MRRLKNRPLPQVGGTKRLSRSSNSLANSNHRQANPRSYHVWFHAPDRLSGIQKTKGQPPHPPDGSWPLRGLGNQSYPDRQRSRRPWRLVSMASARPRESKANIELLEEALEAASFQWPLRGLGNQRILSDWCGMSGYTSFNGLCAA